MHWVWTKEPKQSYLQEAHKRAQTLTYFRVLASTELYFVSMFMTVMGVRGLIMLPRVSPTH